MNTAHICYHFFLLIVLLVSYYSVWTAKVLHCSYYFDIRYSVVICSIFLLLSDLIFIVHLCGISFAKITPQINRKMETKFLIYSEIGTSSHPVRTIRNNILIIRKVLIAKAKTATNHRVCKHDIVLTVFVRVIKNIGWFALYE